MLESAANNSLKPIKIAFLFAELNIGGAERFVQNLILSLDKTIIEPILITLYEPGTIGEQLRNSGVKVFHSIAHSRFDLGIGKKLKDIYDKEKIDVVYVTDSALPMYWAGKARRMSPKPKLIVGFHTTGDRSDFIQHYIANKSTVPVADCFITLAESHRKHCINHYKLPQDKTAVILNGIDIERFNVGDKATAKQLLNLRGDVPLIGIIAALRPEKNHLLLLKACVILKERKQNFHVIIVGDGAERPIIEKTIKDNHLSNEVSMLGARNDTPQIQQAIDIAVLCSKPVVETFPLTLVEALASGTPVVSTDVGSIRDLISNGETGFLVPIDNPTEFAKALETLLNNKSLREHMGKAARERAEQFYRIDKMVDAYQDLFVRLTRIGDQ